MENVFTGFVLSVIGVSLSAFLAGWGSSLAISITGSKGAGVLAEKPHLFGKILILTALPGSQGVYGLLIAVFVLSKIGAFTGGMEISKDVGVQLLMAGLLTGLAGLTSAYFQGKVVAGGIGALARDESLSGKAIVLSVLIETYAIFGLLISLLIVNGVNVG